MDKKEETSSVNELNLLDKLRQKSFINYLKKVDFEKGSSNPWVVEFDPTTACNLACPDCISRELLNKGYFSRERIRDLTKEMVDAGVRAVVLIGGGEPLMHPEIGWIIDYLGKNGVKIGLTTNGLLIDKYLEPIAEYASWVRVSVDAATPETFQKIRPSRDGSSKFNNLIDNIQLLAKHKKGVLGYSFMIYTEGVFDKGSDSSNAENPKVFSNIDEIAQAASLAKESGCDYFEIKPMYNINHFAIQQRKEFISGIKEQIDKSKEYIDDNFRVLQAVKLHDTMNDELGCEKKDYHRCAVADLRTLVTPLGVYVCPYFRGRDDMKIGDVRNDSFTDMWKGDKKKEVFARLDPSVDCKMHCIRNDSNILLEKMMLDIESQKVVDDFDFFI